MKENLMPSRRSDRGAKLKQLPHESDLENTNRKVLTAVTLAPLFGLQGLGILGGAAAIHTEASAKADEKERLEKAVEPRHGRPPVPDHFPVDESGGVRSFHNFDKNLTHEISDSTITQLTDSILQSASGRPFNFSISEGKKKKAVAREALIAMMLNGILSPETEDGRKIQTLEEQLNNFENTVNKDRAKRKGNPTVVHPETQKGNRKAQRETST